MESKLSLRALSIASLLTLGGAWDGTPPPRPAAFAPAAGEVGFTGSRPGAPPASLVILVRHAEKADDGTQDPPLTAGGAERAALLATMFADAGVGSIYTTDFRRTRDTAAPLAAAAGLSPVLYAPAELRPLAEELRGVEGVTVVVGHSNTTAELAAFLGGEPGPPISEDEYDRMYVLTLEGGRATATLVIRFGDPSGP